MPISTNINHLTYKLPQRDARNARLNPEVQTIVKQDLDIVTKEEVEAFKVNPTLIAYYKRRYNGRRCTCTTGSMADKEEAAIVNRGMSIDEFLVDIPALFPHRDNCPVCFDTGFVGGYERIGCHTIVLDYLAPHTASKLEVVTKRPYWLKATSSTGTVSWTLTIPRYFVSLQDIVIRWNEEPRSWALLLNGSPISESLLEANKGNEVTLTLRMKDGNNKNAGVYAVFIVLSLVDDPFVKGDFPNVTRSITSDDYTIDSIVNPIQVNLSNRVNKVEATDLFIDTRFKQIWRLLEIMHNEPIDKVVIHREAQCRRVKAFELYYMLPNKLIQGVYDVPQSYVL
jgi:hypothetical protein